MGAIALTEMIGQKLGRRGLINGITSTIETIQPSDIPHDGGEKEEIVSKSEWVTHPQVLCLWVSQEPALSSLKEQLNCLARIFKGTVNGLQILPQLSCHCCGIVFVCSLSIGEQLV